MNRVFDFDVVKEAICIKSSGQEINRKAIVRQDTGEVLGVVSDNYKLIRHVEAVSYVEENLNRIGNWKVHKERTSKNGAHLFIEYVFSEITGEVQKGDIVALSMILTNSYDGMTRFGFMLGAIRILCTNGLKITNRFFELVAKHTFNLDITNLIDNSRKMVDVFHEKLPAIQNLSRLPLALPFDARVQGIINKGLIPRRLSETILKQGQRDTTTEWGMFNRYTGELTHNYKGSYDRYNELQNQVSAEFGI
ncbi:MAG: hypothetical protein A2252_01500 [Elusimicrobia bacterium RIFOXYA2_FULL_39_19]|nr:MAG: hypothetical protein A2252_01500 [Elusimicrobia bacterium RIFOXYA2_FULL_39_19]